MSAALKSETAAPSTALQQYHTFAVCLQSLSAVQSGNHQKSIKMLTHRQGEKSVHCSIGSKRFADCCCLYGGMEKGNNLQSIPLSRKRMDDKSVEMVPDYKRVKRKKGEAKEKHERGRRQSHRLMRE